MHVRLSSCYVGMGEHDGGESCWGWHACCWLLVLWMYMTWLCGMHLQLRAWKDSGQADGEVVACRLSRDDLDRIIDSFQG